MVVCPRPAEGVTVEAKEFLDYMASPEGITVAVVIMAYFYKLWGDL
jgi:hypothetical protein